jgi:hypothetical protein
VSTRDRLLAVDLRNVWLHDNAGVRQCLHHVSDRITSLIVCRNLSLTLCLLSPSPTWWAGFVRSGRGLALVVGAVGVDVVARAVRAGRGVAGFSWVTSR